MRVLVSQAVHPHSLPVVAALLWITSKDMLKINTNDFNRCTIIYIIRDIGLHTYFSTLG